VICLHLTCTRQKRRSSGARSASIDRTRCTGRKGLLRDVEAVEEISIAGELDTTRRWLLVVGLVLPTNKKEGGTPGACPSCEAGRLQNSRIHAAPAVSLTSRLPVCPHTIKGRPFASQALGWTVI
jgi:hypothetical protein